VDRGVGEGRLLLVSGRFGPLSLQPFWPHPTRLQACVAGKLMGGTAAPPTKLVRCSALDRTEVHDLIGPFHRDRAR